MSTMLFFPSLPPSLPMAAILDHLTAILVGASLLGVLLFVQQRGQQASIDSTAHHNVQVQSFSIMETFERDIENIRNSDQTGERARVLSSAGNTNELRFVTLANPSLGDASPLVAVAYRLEDTFQQVEVNGVPTTLYRVVRFVHDGSGNWVLEGGSTETLVGFNISLISRDGETVVTDGFEPDNFRRVRVEFEAAGGRVIRLAGDQDNMSRANQTRQATTIRPVSLAMDGDTPLPPTTTVPSP